MIYNVWQHTVEMTGTSEFHSHCSATDFDCVDLWKQLHPRFNSFFYKTGQYMTIYTSILTSRAFLGLKEKGCCLICNPKLCITSRSLHLLLQKHHPSSLHLSFFFGQALNSGVNSSGPAAFQPELGALSKPASIIDSGANSSQSASEYHSVMLSSSGRDKGSWLPILHS